MGRTTSGEKNKMITNLKPIYDSRKSFYNKAIVEFENDGTKRLISYTTHVATITNDNKAVVLNTHSPTTLRHIKEFLLQNGFKAENKKQIVADYKEVA